MLPLGNKPERPAAPIIRVRLDAVDMLHLAAIRNHLIADGASPESVDDSFILLDCLSLVYESLLIRDSEESSHGEA